ncbi:hypothetical protein BsWGS_00299 [Bradybaena similaris]
MAPNPKTVSSSEFNVSAGMAEDKLSFPWLEDDLKVIEADRNMTKFEEEALQTFLIDKFEEFVENTPKKTFLIYEDNLFSYELVDQMACRVANIARSWGLGLRDCVAMMMHNEPAFIWTFLGLQKLGIAAALINYNLRSRPLMHSILATDPKYLIVGAGEDLLGAVTEVTPDLGKLQVYVQGLGLLQPPSGVHSFDPLMLVTLPLAISPTVRKGLELSDVCSYIYTSGTTGLPKPAIISQRRAISIGCRTLLAGLTKTDVIYTVLPLYHSAGGGLGLYGSIVTGAMMVLKKKFSASQFWSDCRRYDVTFIQYIGELFRYLLAQPVSTLEGEHKVRVAFGNGLRKDIWLEVDKRFKIPLIAEFFSSTEGTGMTVNFFNKPGAVGRLSPLLKKVNDNSIALVKFDYSTALPIRGPNGRCISVTVGEPGLFLTKIPEVLLQGGEFSPYRSSRDANEKKVVRDVIEAGDMYFNFGDVLTLDKDYFLFFQDRIGDTFRWKGENVSTTEVANVITAIEFVHDANVYGVEVPGNEGRAGMVALTLNEGYSLGAQELKSLYDHVCEELANYARPLFVRHLDEAVVTGTFKQQKFDLINQGFDLAKVTDPLYFLDAERKTYSPLTANDLPKFLASRL